MKDYRLKIIFMGTPEFAVPSLKILIENNYKISAVVTAPDKPAGRGQQVQESAVKRFASERDLLILQPEKLKSNDFIERLKEFKADLQVVVAFRMLPEVVWSMPPLGTINLHASLLPDYRGAAPINWAIINGEKETGLTTFFLQKEIDTGKILFNVKEKISEKDTAGELHDRLMDKGASLLLTTVEAIEAGKYKAFDQSELSLKIGSLKIAPKIFRENCRLKWSRKGHELQNLIRGLSPYPGAWCEINDEKNKPSVLKIFSSEFIPALHNANPGEIITDGKTNLKIAVIDGFINLLSVQLEGRKRMSIEEFIRGQQQLDMISFH